MDYKMEEGKLTVQMQGKIDSDSAPEFEKELFDVISKNPDLEPVLDAEKLEYISSAGLRVLMKLRKQRDKLDMINVSRDVYEIMEVTGFTELFTIRKALRKMSIEGAELIGKGGNGAVYRLDKENIVKVYFGISNPVQKIEQDRLISRQVFIHGINTAIPYDMVQVGEDYGVVFEMIDALTLGQFLSRNPEKTDEYVHRMTELLKQMHRTEFDDDELPDARNLLYHRLKLCADSPYFTPEEIQIMRDMIDRIPKRNTFVHGDFHPGNIMVNDDELILIDVGDSGLGHPVNDLMGMYLLYIVAARSGSSERYCGLNAEILSGMWQQFLGEYFGTRDEEQIGKITQAIGGLAQLKLMQGIVVNPGISDEVRQTALDGVKKTFFGYTDQILEGALGLF
ncbi:MAG: anti-sigma factor antagonist [Lachnospiraceae bacterium]|nr:anti-sigma factor antagonist [Lachnospiraceae bacterium]